ncbi:hypothetical protein QR77_35720 [Streptomyces sp. 150FB]|nr:hypothetical protein QR77_35720 [Streptomyces sp. 150FB]
MARNRWARALGVLAASALAAGLTGPAATAADAAVQHPSTVSDAPTAASGAHNTPAPEQSKPIQQPKLAQKPYMGWSSWSLEATNYPGVNPTGAESWLNEQHILQQADVMASKLKQHGYDYINIDAGWTDHLDQYGRPAANPKTFPHGIKYIADKLHAKGLKVGIYEAVGLDVNAYGGGATPIYGAPGCTTKDLVYPDLRKTNGWDSSYKIDYANPCSQAYADSIADLYASWGVDFLKLDGVGPGSFKGGDNYDNRADVAAWRKALDATGRPIEFTISWSLSHAYAAAWKQNSNGWRVDTDVECYCDTLVTWNNSVKQRWHDVVQWIPDAGPGHWNNLDSLNVGNAEMDGLTQAERQSYMTLWAIEASPLYIGDDLTKLDPYGLSLLTNDEAIAINQAGRPAKPVSQTSDQQTWSVRNADGSYTVALFNLGASPATTEADWSDLGISGTASVHDVWSKKDLGRSTGSFSAQLPAHGSRLLTITPGAAKAPTVPTGVRGTSAEPTSVSLAWDPATPVRGTSVVRYDIRDGARKVASAGGGATSATVAGLGAASAHTFTVVAVDSRGRTSPASTPVPVTTPDTGGPTAHQGEAATLEGGASVADCAKCSGGKKAGSLGVAASVTFKKIKAPGAGTYLATIGYTDGDSGRVGVITVNGKTVQVPFPGSGDNDWDTPQAVTVPVQLTAGENTIQIGNPGDYVADIDQIIL